MKTPVTLVTGFLGAGKTTLVNHLLRESGRRFVVVENEFGELGLDGALIGSAADSVVELTEGCVCCTVREDLIQVFEQMSAQGSRPDHVIIEASGLADPVPVIRVFDQAGIRAHFELNGVVTVIDAEHLEVSLEESPTCAEQVACADLLVLNKADRQDEASLRVAEARLRRLNTLGEVVRATHAEVGTAALFQLRQRRMAALPAIPAVESCGGPKRAGSQHEHTHGTAHGHHHDAPHDHYHDAPHDHHHDAPHHHHDESIVSVSVEATGDVDVVALDRWLGRLARRQGVLRMKGVFAMSGYDRRFVFHGVRSTVEIEPGEPWGDSPRQNRLVFIGRDLSAERLRSGFRDCLQTI